MSSVILATGALLVVSARTAPSIVVFLATALVGVGYAGAQVFPLAMLPDAAAVDARRTGSGRVGVYTGVWTAGETLGLALGPGLFAVVLAIGGYRSSTDGDVAQPDSALTAITLGFSVLPAALVLLSLVWLVRYSLTSAEVEVDVDDVERRPPHDRRPRTAPRPPGRRPAGARRPHPRLRLRLGPARHRPDRPRGGRPPRPRPTASTPPRSRACCGWRTTWSAFGAAAARRARHRRGDGDLRRHRVGAARRADRPRRPARGRAPGDGPALHQARGVRQGRALLRRREAGRPGRRRLPRGRRRHGRGDP